MNREIRPITTEDQNWIAKLLTDHWERPLVVSRGQIHDASKSPGFVAVYDGKDIGLVTYHVDGTECELVTLDSLKENIGIGTALVDAVKREAIKADCTRLWLVTTNDNLHALGFYQKRGFHLVAVHRNAIAESRKIKSSIPDIGIDGIPIRDEIELEIRLKEGVLRASHPQHPPSLGAGRRII